MEKKKKKGEGKKGLGTKRLKGRPGGGGGGKKNPKRKEVHPLTAQGKKGRNMPPSILMKGKRERDTPPLDPMDGK